MARLFSALLPPDEVLDHLAQRLAPLTGFTWMPREKWHITLGFYGDHDEQDTRVPWLRERVAGLAAPTLRLAGAGSFPGVLWIGVTADDALRPLARAAGARGYKPHVTVARYRRGQQGKATAQELCAALADYRGPQWTAAEVLLYRSELRQDGARYHVADRVHLRR